MKLTMIIVNHVNLRSLQNGTEDRSGFNQTKKRRLSYSSCRYNCSQVHRDYLVIELVVYSVHQFLVLYGDHLYQQLQLISRYITNGLTKFETSGNIKLGFHNKWRTSEEKSKLCSTSGARGRRFCKAPTPKNFKNTKVKNFLKYLHYVRQNLSSECQIQR